MAPPRKRVPKAVKAVLQEHRGRLERLIDRRSLPALKKIYSQASNELGRKLRAKVRAGLGDEFTAHQYRIALAQIRDGQKEIVARMAGELREATGDAQVEALHGLIDDIGRLERHFRGAVTPLPIQEASQFQGIIDGRQKSILRGTEQSLARYGADSVAGMEDALTVSLATGETLAETIGRLEEFTDGQWWRAERIARTEISGAFNLTHRDGIEDAADEVDGLRMRWSEHVDDDSYEPYDDRVGTDSIALHGQVASPGELFTTPYTAPRPGADGTTQVSEYLAGDKFESPPNRPNDRAVLEPWHPIWGIPGWIWRAGSRQWL